jgi:phage anti-repressor protein
MYLKGELFMKQLMKQLKQTPIEILLQVDGEGKTTARKLYEFLNLAKGQFSRWAKTNILENAFAENGIDFEGFDINVEGNLTKDYKLTASFAKKLAMSCQNERGEQAREYFIKVEEKLKQTISKKATSSNDEKAKLLRAEAMSLNAKTRAFKTLLQSMDNKKLSPLAMEVFGLKALESAFGADVGNYLPKVEKTYSAKEVGDMLGISANKVGRLANANGLKTPEYGRYVADKSKNSDKEVETFRYNETGVKVLQELAW